MVLILPTPLASFVTAPQRSVKRWRWFFRVVAVLQAGIGLTQVVMGDKDGLIVCIMAFFSWRLVDSSLSWIIFVGVGYFSHVGLLWTSLLRARAAAKRLTPEAASHVVLLQALQMGIRIALSIINIACGVVAICVYRVAAPTDRSMFVDILPLIQSESMLLPLSSSANEGAQVEALSGTAHKLCAAGRESFVLPAATSTKGKPRQFDPLEAGRSQGALAEDAPLLSKMNSKLEFAGEAATGATASPVAETSVAVTPTAAEKTVAAAVFEATGDLSAV